jgi:hypothetical protein
MQRFAEEKGIPIADHHGEIDTDMHKVMKKTCGRPDRSGSERKDSSGSV